MLNLRRLNAWFIQPIAVIALLVAGAWASTFLVSQPQRPDRSEAPEYRPLVEVVDLEPGTQPIRLRGFGTLRPRRTVELATQVGGRVAELDEALRPGGVIREGQVLLRIEPVEFELAVRQAEADLVQRRRDLAVERAEADAAVAEWRDLEPDTPAPPLVARLPQIAAAEGAVASAEAALGRARLDLDRATLRAPFDGRVTQASVEAGRVVAPNTTLASVYATDALEVPVPVRADELAYLRLPAPERGSPGSPATLTVQTPEGPVEVPAVVDRLGGQADAATRLVEVILRVEPDGLLPEVTDRLLPGLFLPAVIQGPVLEDAVRLPRALLRDRGRVFVYDGGVLRILEPRIAYRDREDVLLTGIDRPIRVVQSPLEIATPGMRLALPEATDP